MLNIHDYTSTERAILNRDNYRCLHCGRPGEVIHEIRPKSRNPNWQEPDNRVTLCVACHAWAHHVSTRISGPILSADLQRHREHHAEPAQPPHTE